VNMMKMLRDVQQAQARLAAVQQELARREVEAQSGGGVVKVTARGDGTFISIRIDPQAVDPQDVEMLQDLVLSAVNAAADQVRQLMSDEMAKATGGLKIPGLSL